jgi:trimeric autotransporter adhesin
LKFFQPGRGYKLFVSNANSINILKSGEPEDLPLKHEYNMTLTATVNFASLPVSEDYTLRTFINGQNRGEIPLTYVDGLNQFMAFNMIYGDRADIGEKVNVSLWDNINQKEIELTSTEINFGIDKIAGTINNPVVLFPLSTGIQDNNENSFNFATYPNPFSRQTQITYFIPTDTHVVLTITDSFGKQVKRIVDNRQSAGQYDYTFEAENLASGIYFCTLKTDNYVETKKLILMKE